MYIISLVKTSVWSPAGSSHTHSYHYYFQHNLKLFLNSPNVISIHCLAPRPIASKHSSQRACPDQTPHWAAGHHTAFPNALSGQFLNNKHQVSPPALPIEVPLRSLAQIAPCDVSRHRNQQQQHPWSLRRGHETLPVRAHAHRLPQGRRSSDSPGQALTEG